MEVIELAYRRRFSSKQNRRFATGDRVVESLSGRNIVGTITQIADDVVKIKWNDDRGEKGWGGAERVYRPSELRNDYAGWLSLRKIDDGSD